MTLKCLSICSSPVHPTTKEQSGRAIRLGYLREDLTVSKMISSCAVIAMPTRRACRLDLAAIASTLESGAAFGATLYRDLVLSCANWCNVDI
jgi:hypothetical protein